MGVTSSVQTPRRRTTVRLEIEEDSYKDQLRAYQISNKLVKTEISHPRLNLERLIMRPDPQHVLNVGPWFKHHHHHHVPRHLVETTFPDFKIKKFENKFRNHWDDMANESRTRLPIMNGSSKVVKSNYY